MILSWQLHVIDSILTTSRSLNGIAGCDNLCGSVNVNDKCGLGVLIVKNVGSAEACFSKVTDVEPPGECCAPQPTDPDTGVPLPAPVAPKPGDNVLPVPILPIAVDNIDEKIGALADIWGDIEEEPEESLAKRMLGMFDDLLDGMYPSVIGIRALAQG
jgi:hypothetical protein